MAAGIRVGNRGRTSIRYGLIRHAEGVASTEGHFVHVYVDRLISRPVPLPSDPLAAIAPLGV